MTNRLTTLRGDPNRNAGLSSRIPLVSVLMPVHNAASFLARALESLLAQSVTNWELIAVDDGSSDESADLLRSYARDNRVTIERLQRNIGLGAALNRGLERARAPVIAYLPADDVYYAQHLEALLSRLAHCARAPLAYTGVRHHYNRFARGRIEGYPLQLVQVAHRRTTERWVERAELVTDDLDRMFWSRLGSDETWAATDQVTCEWVDHPAQRHKVIQEPEGGINPYRARYRVQEPMRFHSTVGNPIDERERFRRFRDRPPTPASPDGLKILLAGELAYNAERVLALEERGHTLYGLWTPEPYWYNTVGPLPFGHVQDLPRSGWQDAIREVRPDLIYALLSWQAVPFVHHVLNEVSNIPLVWHFKEGPFICMEKGTWPQLVDLYRRSAGRIFSSPEMRGWFETVAPGTGDAPHSLVLDGDLPKRDWFQSERSARLSDRDDDVHTVVPGRPIGLAAEVVAALAAHGIHLHFYGDYTQGQWRAWIERAVGLAPRHLHLHPHVDQEHWVPEFSQYDAGWLHNFASRNQGEIRRADWDDLNYPARIGTFAAAGLPMIQADNRGSIVAAQKLAEDLDLGVFFSSIEQLGQRLRDARELNRVRESVWRQRDLFTFDAHADRLIEFFRSVIADRR